MKKTFKECFDENGHTYGAYHAPLLYNKPFQKLREAEIPEEYDTLIINLPMNPTRQYLFQHAYFATNVLIELNKNGLLVGHPKGIDYFHYISQQFSGPTSGVNYNYFHEDLPAAVELFADLLKKGLFVDNFDGLKTIMCGSAASNNHAQKAQLFIEFAEESKQNAFMEPINKSQATLLIAQKGNPAFSGKQAHSDNSMSREQRQGDNQKRCVIS